MSSNSSLNQSHITTQQTGLPLDQQDDNF